MQEMILNHASAAASGWSAKEANVVLADLAQGMATLVVKMDLPKTLRLQCGMETIPLTQDASLLDLLFAMQRSPAREEARFWLSLAQKMPLLADLPATSINHFYAFEPAQQLGAAAQPLMLCVHQGAIAISFPTTPQWDVDLLDIPFTEILRDGSIHTSSEVIDNLARLRHVPAILARHQQQCFTDLDPATFWQQRQRVFPSLSFGQDVEAQLRSLGGNQFWTIMRRLADLNASAAAWCSGPAPNWHTKVTPESEPLMSNPKLAATREFRNADGFTCSYAWHARYGSSGRIHLRFDASQTQVEVGYIGPHLPL